MGTTGRPLRAERALLAGDEARHRLLEAASRCIVRRGNTQIRMAEVAAEAGVVRSTVYRYFPSRDDLLLGLLLTRIDAALAAHVASLPQPDDASASIQELMLVPVQSVVGDALNEALMSGESTAVATALEIGSEQIVDVVLRHYGPLFERWQADGSLHPELDPRETARWLHTASLFLLAPVWRHRPVEAKRLFVEQYLLRALVPNFV
ncbi:TetR/AcrR family transcriptional regulator [Mycolicibacterium aichiense]|uniref:TetR family transcriptional regulator n=1 Tax=Mycolicibacterium aichiense TaxID=1799 RepID=A0AAD1HTM5_9MYCO|nr:TetR/AcrR family transcriptional regulator [Mycolicibacterium aichiense]MCV7018745.1 TetR/AcrR family transcriptional regulator [Mycolicibacterium aichiense]BBX10779.1 TetR family transcriptional regulator [Mycolicibacterium aichiense]STZ25564.1 TetR family transcriptional regulator [Mycolicibacterium aichiense]